VGEEEKHSKYNERQYVHTRRSQHPETITFCHKGGLGFDKYMGSIENRGKERVVINYLSGHSSSFYS